MAPLIIVGLSLADASCAATQAAAAPTSMTPTGMAAPAAANGSSPIGAPGVGWAVMAPALRKEFMKAVVMPKAKELFVAFDAVRHENMTCRTCHGDGAVDGSFRMPNPSLPKLPDSPEGFKRLTMEKPAVCQFMLAKVKPTMAALLGMPELTPDTRSGFGCLSCHPR
jgi:hypothetical protein